MERTEVMISSKKVLLQSILILDAPCLHPPPCGEGRDGGSSGLKYLDDTIAKFGATPTLSPSPQGGGR